MTENTLKAQRDFTKTIHLSALFVRENESLDPQAKAEVQTVTVKRFY